VIRIVLDGGFRLPLVQAARMAGGSFPGNGAWVPSLVEFFVDRLKVALRDKGVRHDLIDAVFALGGQDDLALVVRRVQALQGFLGTDDGRNLLAGYKRAVNILKIEEGKEKKKDAKFAGFTGKPDVALLEAAQ
jgi:glycyl-tRNA synthetase beta chain